MKYSTKQLVCLLLATGVVFGLLRSDDADLPPCGYGFLQLLRNESAYPAKVFFERNVHDNLPPETTVHIKSLSDGKYYRVFRGEPLPGAKEGDVRLVADVVDPLKDKATLFTVKRFVDYNLNDWITFASDAVRGYVMSIDGDANSKTYGKVLFKDTSFEDSDLNQAHWAIIPDDENTPLDALCLTNASNKGNLHVMTKKEQYSVGIDEKKPVDAVWGTTLPLVDDNVLTYGSVITIRSTESDKAFMWTHRSEPFGRKNCSELLFFDSNNDQAARRRSCLGRFMVLDPVNPGSRGPVKYKDKILVYSLWSSFWPPETTRLITPDKLDSEGRWAIVDKYRDEAIRDCSVVIGGTFADTKSSLFSIAKAGTKDATGKVDASAEDTEGFVKLGERIVIKSEVDVCKGERLWKHPHSRYGDGHHEIIVKDVWSPADKDRSKDPSFNQFIIDKISDTDVRRMVLEGKDDPLVKNDIWQKILLQVTDTVEQAYKLSDKSVTLSKSDTGWVPQATDTFNLRFVAVYKEDDVWGIAQDKTLMHYDGTWQNESTKVIDISVGIDGIPWCVGTDNKVYCKSGDSWDSMLDSGNALKVGALNSTEAWTVLDDGTLRQYKKDTGFQVPAVSFTGGKVIELDVDINGIPWVLNENGEPFRYKDGKWKKTGGLGFVSIAAQSDDVAWATDRNRQVFSWNGKKWESVKGLLLSSIAVSHGSEVTKEAPKSERVVTTAYTVDDTNNPYSIDNPDAHIAIEIVTLGVGSGGVLPNSTMPFVTLPIAKKPKVSGYALTELPNFSEGSLLHITPLINRGVAWLKQSFALPGAASVSFFTGPESGDEIQVAFGDKATPQDILCKVIIGTGGTAVQLRTDFDDGEPVFKTVYEVTKAQNPAAVTSPGNVVPYTVSINDGLLLAFRGDALDGELIAAYSIPKSSDLPEPIFVGFSSGSQQAEYTGIKVGDPIEIMVPERNYFDDATATMSIPAGPAATWTNFPFRIPDQGSFGFRVKADGPFSVVFGTEKNQTSGHYVVAIDQNILVKKWDTSKKKYIDLTAPIDLSDYDFNIDPDGFMSLWVSYAEGVMIVGTGAFDERGLAVLTVINDPQQHRGVQTFGFSASAGAEVKSFRVAPQVTFGYKVGDTLYKKPRQLPKFSGSMTVILPFEYQFSQEKGSPAITCFDNVTKGRSISDNTPTPGAHFNYMAKLDATGGIALGLINVDNLLLKKAMQDAQNKMDEAARKLLTAQGDIQKGQLQAELKSAEAALESAKAAAGLQTANFMRDTGTELIRAAASIPLPPTMNIIAGVGTVAAVGSMLRAGLTEINLRAAAAKELEGAQQLNKAKQAALDQQMQAQQLQLAAQQAQDRAQALFKAPDSTGYVDEAKQRELATQSIPQDALDNRAQLEAMLKAMGTQQDVLQACVDMLNVIDHPYVTQEEGTKKAVWQWLSKLNTWFLKNSAALEPETRSGVMNVLFMALNNPYLADPTQRQNCYTWINTIVRNALLDNKQQSIDLQMQFGEYVWLPFSFKNADQGAIMFQVLGNQNLFVCLSPEANKPKLNTDDELYEILLGGWNNTKSAIRLQSLGNSVKEVTQKVAPAAMLDPQEYRTFWISLNNGLIQVGRDEPGKNVLFSWQDPYPITGIRYMGLSCWDTPVTVANIKVADSASALVSEWAKLKGEVLEKPVFVDSDAQEPEAQADDAGQQDDGALGDAEADDGSQEAAG